LSYQDVLEAAWKQHLAPRIADAPTIISTFAGCGGSSLGYSMAGFRELLAVEWDDNAVATFRLNFLDVPMYHGDISQLTVADVLARTGLQSGELDVFDGSPPCQGFSTAGKRDFEDDRNQLFREYVRLLRGLKPRAFVMENVSGMVKGKMKLIFADILRELKASGYRVSARLMNAMYFNVPQSRERMIFIGVRDDLETAPSHPKATSRPQGCVRCDARAANYSDRRYGDALEYEGQPIGTITKIGRKFWARSLEFGPLSYSINASFPSEFQFVGDLTDRKARVGNSVPPLFMRAIAENIRDVILSKPSIAKAA
jgi:DNA (cytosine-5)-methyltransferase 1